MARWDVIVVGARIAGSTLAAYLGRAGARVLLLERARFPADLPQQGSWGTDVNHRLAELGVLPRIEALGAPRVTGYSLSTAGVLVHYSYPEVELGFRMCVRRARLDRALSEFAASYRSVELREGFMVTNLLSENGRIIGVLGSDGRREFEERATLVVGADGRNSRVARLLDIPSYQEVVSPWASYIADFAGTNTPRDRSVMAWTHRSHMVIGPVDQDLVTSAIGVRVEDLDRFRAGLPGSFEQYLRDDPHLCDVLGDGIRISKVGGAINLRMYRRVPTGPGWAVVGDAGYHLDPWEPAEQPPRSPARHSWPR